MEESIDSTESYKPITAGYKNECTMSLNVWMNEDSGDILHLSRGFSAPEGDREECQYGEHR